ncbi:MAG: hypothetical protein U7123_13170 [Potamolinea sp.]
MPSIGEPQRVSILQAETGLDLGKCAAIVLAESSGTVSRAVE